MYILHKPLLLGKLHAESFKHGYVYIFPASHIYKVKSTLVHPVVWLKSLGFPCNRPAQSMKISCQPLVLKPKNGKYDTVWVFI